MLLTHHCFVHELSGFISDTIFLLLSLKMVTMFRRRVSGHDIT